MLEARVQYPKPLNPSAQRERTSREPFSPAWVPMKAESDNPTSPAGADGRRSLFQERNDHPGPSPRLLSLQKRTILRGLVFILVLVLVGFLIEATGLKRILDAQWVDGQIREKGVTGWAMFVGVSGLLIAVGLPRQVPSFFGGYAFGAAGGALLALIACGFGCAIIFGYARFLCRGFLANRLGKRARDLDSLLCRNPFFMTVVIRFMPVGSNLLTSSVAGMSSVPFSPFFFGSMVGYTPQVLIFSLLGSGIRVDPTLRISVAVLLFVISMCAGFALYRKYCDQKG
ncbi:MAG: VTT domain-containing protein [Deltaproteobacteria bacterium]|nr:VTT domain-containing protein [Deltaproteobacteria bacterium]